jgi:pyruvate decarboxylase
VVKTQAELDTLLNNPEFNVPDRIRVIELVMPRGDAPAALVAQAKLTAKANSE